MQPDDKGVPLCSTCGRPLQWVDRYKRFFCMECRKYPPRCPCCLRDLSFDKVKNCYSCQACMKDYLPGAPEVTCQPEMQETVPSGNRGIPGVPLFQIVLGPIDNLLFAVQKLIGPVPCATSGPAPVLYANPRPPGTRNVILLLAMGIALIGIVTAILFFPWFFSSYWLFFICFTGPVLYLAWIWWTDRYEREPKIYVFIVFAAGFAVSVPAYFLNSLLGFIPVFLVSAVTEEVLKGICVYWMGRKEEFNDSMDGIVYGSATGTGFAVAENIFYVFSRYQGDPVSSVMRILLWALGHPIYSAMCGRWLGIMKVRTGVMKAGFLIPGVLVAIVMHTIYNASGILVPVLGNITWLIICGFIVVMAIRQAISEEIRYGYHLGKAPV